jgi:hypothetical protein
MKKILFLISILAFSLSVSAQIPQHDKQKEHQIRSMEAGHWDFSPDWYYYFLHKHYSGAGTYWKWAGFKSRVAVRFKESKSNVKGVAARRLLQLEAEKSKAKVVEAERKKIKELNEEELKRFADRNVDLMYSKYADIFNEMQKSIKDGLNYCYTASNGKLQKAVLDLADRNEVITSNIAYLRKTGQGYELENVKREQGYAKAKSDMEELKRSVFKLANLCRAYYDTK